MSPPDGVHPGVRHLQVVRPSPEQDRLEEIDVVRTDGICEALDELLCRVPVVCRILTPATLTPNREGAHGVVEVGVDGDIVEVLWDTLTDVGPLRVTFGLAPHKDPGPDRRRRRQPQTVRLPEPIIGPGTPPQFALEVEPVLLQGIDDALRRLFDR